MSTVNQTPTTPYIGPVDFGWYSSNAPLLFDSTIGSLQVPYGLTQTAAAFTTPANASDVFPISALDASSFIGGSGTNANDVTFSVLTGQYLVPLATLYIYTSATNWALIGYSMGPNNQAPIVNNTFQYCFVLDGYNGGFNLTFNANTQIYDPRWATYQLPLSAFTTTLVTFDAMDVGARGLPNCKQAEITSFHWDFGNGLQADGPVVETEYWYTGALNLTGDDIAAPTQVQVTLTAIDIAGNTHHVSHPIVFSAIYNEIGAPFTPAYID